MQNSKLIFAFILFIICSSSLPIENRNLIVLFEPLKIIAPKNSPPYFAYQDLMDADTRSGHKGEVIAVGKNIELRAGKEISDSISQATLMLAELRIKREQPEVEAGLAFNRSNFDISNWKDRLTSREQERIRRAGSELVDNDWTDLAWDDHVNKVLVENGVIHQAQPNYSKKQVEVPLLQGQQRIKGPIEMCCGLALTNQHRFSIRRYSEGIPKEIGSVDPAKGEFYIDIQEPIGEIVATLSDEKGKILGEGFYKINGKSPINSGVISVPTIQLMPKKRIYGSTRSLYNENNKKSSAPSNTRVFGFNGEGGIPISKEGVFEDSRFSTFSTSSIEAISPQHWKTSYILTSGVESKVILFPEKFILSMENILRDNPVYRFNESIETVIWGKTQQDGKPVSGIRISLENDPTSRVFYLNEFYFPDPVLTSTSSSGIYVIVNAREGFQSLSAFRDKDFFGYKNILAKRRSVAIGDIESTIKINPTAIRIFDAFDGSSLVATVHLQSHPDPIRIEAHQEIPLPQIQREGILIADNVGLLGSEATPLSPDYLSAQYFYNESRDFIRVPGIKGSWLDAIKLDKKININPNAGIVVGFFDEENFEAYVGGNSEDSAFDYTVIYFDSNGNITADNFGHAGGGFVIFNAPPDAQNIVLIGKNSETINSRLIPVNPEKISVLNF